MQKIPARKSREDVQRRAPAPLRLARIRRVRKGVFHAVAAMLLVGGMAWLIGHLKSTIARPLDAASETPNIVFTHRPAWMTDLVLHELAESFRPDETPSVFDRDALVRVNRRLKSNAWIGKVREVRRVYGESAGDIIEIDCDFRAPLALVRDGDAYWFVDAKGVKLPEKFSEKELPLLIYAKGKVNLRVIEGVRNAAPRLAGQLWPGDDLAAGLGLAEKLNGQPFADDVIRINVANYAGRIDAREAHLVLGTRLRLRDREGHEAGPFTEVRWGRPWNASDAFIEVKPERKLEAMRLAVEKYGRVDALQPWIDLRFDTVKGPSQPSTQDGGHADGGR